MASLVLGFAGASLGANFGGAILGMSGAAIGGAIGTALGTVADSWLAARLGPQQRTEGARLDALRITSSTEGAVLARVYGRVRIGGNIIWATDFVETRIDRRQRVSKFQRVTVTEYSYSASLAVVLCEGPITGIGLIWVDGAPLDTEGINWRWYPGSETQAADPLIVARMGADAAPAYRGTAYVVFEDLELERFGNRIPQFSFEVFRPLADPDTAEGAVRAVTMIPGAGEFAYAAAPVRLEGEGEVIGGDAFTPPAGSNEGPAVNRNARPGLTDLEVALDHLQALAPAVEAVSLVVTWFGDDLRLGSCTIRPKVETSTKQTTPDWQVNGVTRGAAPVVSMVDGKPAFGGTPADFSVVQAIQELKARGLRVTFYPFIMMDIPAGNSLPDPYSANAAATGQAVYPWRGRITCSPAAGYAGTVNKTAAAASQVAAFFGSASPSDFAVTGTTVSWTGGSDWGFRRMVLHYAHLCAAAGGVDAFLIGTEMRGLTWVRSAASTYPAVEALRDLAEDVRAILGAGTEISYAADWSEYSGHQPPDGSGDIHFHLDPLWSHPDIDVVAIDNYMPLSDWRDGAEHLDAAAGWHAVHDRAYLQSNLAGGEGFSWFYATAADRADQVRTPIKDGAYGKPWVFRYKDLRSWWQNQHVNRPGGVEAASPTAWVPQSKPIVFTEFGCPAIDRGTNQPNVFVDPKSSESFFPHFSRGWRDDAIQRAYLEATALWWQSPANNPVSSVYAERMLRWADCAAWTWDARPYPFFPALTDVWSDGGNWRLGHWLNGRLGSVALAALVRHLCLRAGLPEARVDVSGLWGAVEGFVVPSIESPRATIAGLARLFGFDACESGGVIRFAMRGRAPSAVVDLDGTAAAGALPVFEPVAASERELFERTRAQETELPSVLRWTHARSDDETYDQVVVEARRIGVAHVGALDEAFPVALPPEEAERQCRRALREAWVAREGLRLQLPPSALALDPIDAVQVQAAGVVSYYRLTTIADGSARAVEAVRAERESGGTGAGSVRAARVSAPPALSAPQVAFLDIPLVSEGAVDHRPRIAAFATPWPGSMAIYRGDGASGPWAALDVFARRAVIGSLQEALPAALPGVRDRGPGALVRLRGGTLATISEAEFLAGGNLVALQVAGGWELLQARVATLVGPGEWRLTELLRGQRGTEWAVADPAPVGSVVVVVDPELPELSVALAEIGLPVHLRIGPSSRPVQDGAFAQGLVTPRGVGLRCFAPVQLRAQFDGADLRLSWVRRDRALAADSWEAPEVVLSEAAESYRVEVLDGSVVVRTWTATAPEQLYSAAQQAADWGAALVPGDLLTFRVAQVSAPAGPGIPAVATIVV